MTFKKITEHEQFSRALERVERIPFSGCWIYMGSLTSYGYGYTKSLVTRKNIKMHKLFYEKLVAPVPNGLQVLHTCDVRCCVNPYHLWLGTAGDNYRDMHAKNRHYHVNGENHGFAKLTNPNHIELLQMH